MTFGTSEWRLFRIPILDFVFPLKWPVLCPRALSRIPDACARCTKSPSAAWSRTTTGGELGKGQNLCFVFLCNNSFFQAHLPVSCVHDAQPVRQEHGCQGHASGQPAAVGRRTRTVPEPTLSA